ncbi:MAG: hypothetical protein QXH55_04940 [Candidatus Korarchaeota archaeon]|nr:hypothetical protein [Thermoproteota archaeon]MCR8463244.1 hypothetical protein [Thermoproteota archaeon]MCR8470481.1 hypothetical protein [Thermoproteota archaeon]MCR8471498.1 hypothetical protein [Thermoproteota archaeon]MCR8473367.1 hypothetical protein [Thermoproteota archaeon]
MIPKSLFDCMIVLNLKSIGDVLRMEAFISRKTNRSFPLYRCSSFVYTILRRSIAFKKRLAIVAGAKITGREFIEGRVIYYSYYKDTILKNPTDRLKYQTYVLEDIASEECIVLDEDEVNSLEDFKRLDSETIRGIALHDWQDLIKLAFLLRDLVIRLDLKEAGCVLFTGLTSRIFSPVEPFLTVFYVTVGEYVGLGANYVEISDELNFVKRITLRTLKFVPIINARRVSFYENIPEGARDNFE